MNEEKLERILESIKNDVVKEFTGVLVFDYDLVDDGHQIAEHLEIVLDDTIKEKIRELKIYGELEE
jgi:hypothetical protein